MAHFILDLLTKTNFLPKADMHTKRAAYQHVLRLVKLFLYVMGYVLSRVGDEPVVQSNEGARPQVEILKHTLQSIIGTSDHTLRPIATKLAQSLSDEMLSAGPEGDNCRLLFGSALQWSLPDIATIRALVNLAWAASTGSYHLLTSINEMGQENSIPETADFTVCKEALEVLGIGLVLNHSAYEALSQEPSWSNFITSLVLINPSRMIRQTAGDQIYYSCTYCAADRRPFSFMVKLLLATLHKLVPQYAASCSEFFHLFCRILR